MVEDKLYEIVETRYAPTKQQTRLDFLGKLAEAETFARSQAAKNIGVRYAVFPQHGSVAVSQFYYRTTVTCPHCNTVIPIE